MDNMQLLANLNYQLYRIELAAVLTKTVIIHCNQINLRLKEDSLPHSTVHYTVAWTINYFAKVSFSGSIYTLDHSKINNIAILPAILRR